MGKLNDYDIQFLIERLQKGEPIPDDYKYKLFPTKQKEYELVYAGKMRKEDILANEDGAFPVPLQVEKVFNENEYSANENEWRNMIVFGDNLQFLKTVYENKDPLIKDKVKGKVKLVYIDPPFGTGDEYDANKGQSAYTAKTKGAEFVEFLRRRLIPLKEIIASDGFIFIRLDYHFGHYIKVILDEIFLKNNFRNEFVVNRIKKNVTNKGRRTIPNAVDSLFAYGLSDNSKYKDILRFLKERREGYWHNMESAGFSGPRQVVIDGKTYYPSQNSHFKFTQRQADEMIEAGKIRVHPRTNKPEYWVEPKDFETLDSNWTDIPGYAFTTNYPTENSEDLLKRVINLTTSPGDLVMDVFAGSGTTMAVSEKLGRRWIVCDIGKFAFYTMQRRILAIGNSRDLENPKKKYSKKASSFITINTGLYDLKKVFEMRKDEYIEFVMNLFEVEPINKKISGIKINGQKKDGYFVLVYPYWEFAQASVDEEYLEDLHSYIGSKVGERLYIIAPANYVDFISDYHEIENVRYYFLKVPYQIIKELHKVQFKKFRQPQSKRNVNDLEDAIGFHFIRQPEVESRLVDNGGGNAIQITKFLSNYLEEESGNEMKNLESLAMVLIDKDYNGKEFVMDEFYFAEDLLPKKKEDETEDEIKEELKQLNEIIISLNKDDCGERLMIVYVDIYGNEFKEILSLRV